MKKRILMATLLLTGAVASATIAADYSDPKKRNPTGDRDVERGFQEHQREYKERQEREERRRKKEIESPYEVDRGGIDDANRQIQSR